jgi:hypothetical protein
MVLPIISTLHQSGSGVLSIIVCATQVGASDILQAGQAGQSDQVGPVAQSAPVGHGTVESAPVGQVGHTDHVEV